LLETIALWQAMRSEPERDWVPRVKIFAGKAAAGYAVAKLIIKLANDVAAAINTDPLVKDRLKVVFLPNYNVSLAEVMIPAADVSEQISTAGMEASGTGNMKLALNGALTIGTLDGANIEIRERVGTDHIFIFGLRADEASARRRDGWDPADAIAASPPLARAIGAIEAGALSPGDPQRFERLTQALRHADDYLVTADFEDYWNAQRRIDALYQQHADWAKACIMNIAGMGWFSSDRAIRGYAEAIWQTPVSE
jgi:starch phosphorylase